MRWLLPGLFLAIAFAAGGCATATGGGAPIVYAPERSAAVAPAPSPVDPGVFADAPRAPLLGDLRVCGGRASNAGPVDDDGRSLLFTSYIFTSAVALLRAPIAEGCLSSGFGRRGGGARVHSGIDLADSHGGFVFAAAAGYVVALGPRGDYGLAIELDHGEGVHTLYGHLSAIDPRLRPGAAVAAGAAIGLMGATGNATGIHLHYEVSLHGQKVDPLRYGLPPDARPEGVTPAPAAIAYDHDGAPPPG